MNERTALIRRIRVCLAIVIAGLAVSGLTAFPLREELALGRQILRGLGVAAFAPEAVGWVDRVGEGLDATAAAFPFIAYGTDWLAFAHLLIAVAFIGPWRDPVRNVFVLQWGLVACAGIIPLALIAGRSAVSRSAGSSSTSRSVSWRRCRWSSRCALPDGSRPSRRWLERFGPTSPDRLNPPRSASA